MFFPTRARLASRRPPMHRRRNLENYVIPALRVRGSRLAIHATVCRAAGDLEAWRNKILTIFAPYTFSRSQGQQRRLRDVHSWSALTSTRDVQLKPERRIKVAPATDDLTARESMPNLILTSCVEEFCNGISP